ncbi:DUF418 domain-containing protein [Sphingomonas sp. AP4-R1]|uniref:DUF418 domain-containing protein n=1 Tax=Sphingomonas sp. AP4-R1 TaxID=2735134 RepID=UPI001493B801|nr:DUF418 domain-containing protein [Sphingomonas sp. AP4-R1]QJU57759.1 DUF418 domain-containing protein [Sphingomonas sp. AP4-R1]
MSNAITSTSASDRIANLDLLRGIAFCAILPVNVVVMGTVGDREGLLYPSHWDLNRILWSVLQVLFEGPARGMFMMLFGVGMALMLKRTEGPNPQITPVDVWTRRCLILLGFGVIQFAVFMWPGEVLWDYGIAGLALLAFRVSRLRTLWLFAALILLGLCGLRAYVTYERSQNFVVAAQAEDAKARSQTLTPAQQKSLDAARGAHDALYPSPSTVNDEIQQRTHLGTLLAWSANGWVARHLSTWSWPSVAECLSLMLIGLGLYRTGFVTAQAQSRTYVIVCLVGYGVGLTLRLAALGWLARTGFEAEPHRVIPEISALRSFIYEPARLCVSVGHLSLFTLLFRFGALGKATALRSLGRMSLTTYSLQSVLTSIFFYGCGMVGLLSFSGLMAVAVTIWVATGIFAVLWLRKFSMGPAEWLIRAGAYGRWKPLSMETPRLRQV